MIQLKHALLPFIAVPALLLLIAQGASAFYFGGYGEDYYFEIYSKGSYSYAAAPYTYYYSDHYYFDYPFRFYAKGTYYYMEPGWYNFHPEFYYYPGNTSYYTYHGPDYYFYDGYWTFAPDWAYSYGPAYYGAYFYPPSHFFAGTPTLTGQHYQPEQISLCSDASIAATSVSLKAGETKTVAFFIDNTFAKDLRIHNASVFTGSFDAQALNVQFDKTIPAFSSGTATFSLSAKPGAITQSVPATIKVNGTFSDGVFCSGNEIAETFFINIQGKPVPAQTTPDSLHTGAFHNPSGSTSFIEQKTTEPQQEWRDITVTRSHEKEQATLAQQNAQNAQSTQADTAQTYYGETQPSETGCSGLSLGSQNIAVDAESSKTVYFTLKNFGRGDFQIDSIEAVESNGFFGIEATRENQHIFAGQTGAIKVNVLGGTAEKDVTGSAHIRVNGHYNSGLGCTIASDTFFVRVNGSGAEFAGEASISNPNNVKLEGGSGFVKFSVDNPTNRNITVTVRSDNAIVSPKKFSISAMSLAERAVSVNGLDGEGIVYFDVEEEPGFLEKFTRIKAVEMNAPTPVTEDGQGDGPAEPPEESAEEPGETITGQGNGFLVTGFAFLAENSLLLGAIILILLIVFLAVPRER